MATIKAYTDLEQSKKLAEFLPIESADMYWDYDIQKHEDYPMIMDEQFDDLCTPAWSLAALMDMLPSEFTEKGKYSETTYNIDIRKYALTEDTDLYQIAYGNYRLHEDGNLSWSDMINTGEKENLIDAAFDMICWLKENGKI